MGVVVSSEGRTQVIAAARKAHPLETGGILLGYRRNGSVLIVEALEIEDPHASPASYGTNAQRIQDALDRELRRLPEGTGYVGPWHAHPGPSDHSTDDRRALRRIARQYRNPIASIVAIRTGLDYEMRALVGHHRKRIVEAAIELADVDEFPTGLAIRRIST